MPFTPYHFGPGAAVKAMMPRHFSFTIFCLAQVVTDLETAYYMLRGLFPWHRFFHTYLGATLVAIFSLAVGRSLCQWALRLWAGWPAAPFRQYFPVTTVIPLRSAVTGTFLGTYSHVLLDSMMHDDARPFIPFSSANPFFGIVGWFALHASCVILGLCGAGYMATKRGSV